MIREEHVQRGHCREEAPDLTKQKGNAVAIDPKVAGSIPATDIPFLEHRMSWELVEEAEE